MHIIYDLLDRKGHPTTHSYLLLICILLYDNVCASCSMAVGHSFAVLIIIYAAGGELTHQNDYQGKFNTISDVTVHMVKRVT